MFERIGIMFTGGDSSAEAEGESAMGSGVELCSRRNLARLAASFIVPAPAKSWCAGGSEPWSETRRSGQAQRREVLAGPSRAPILQVRSGAADGEHRMRRSGPASCGTTAFRPDRARPFDAVRQPLPDAALRARRRVEQVPRRSEAWPEAHTGSPPGRARTQRPQSRQLLQPGPQAVSHCAARLTNRTQRQREPLLGSSRLRLV